MFRIDNSSASSTLPAQKPVGAPGYFTAGTVGGVPATIVEADWLNNVQEELLAILAADGMTPDKTNRGQVIAAILDLIQKLTRRRLTGPLTLYVDGATGNDLNNGLTPQTAYATPQAAWNYIAEFLDNGGYTITIQIAHGTYSSLVCQGQPLGMGGIQILGDINNPTAVTIQSATNDLPAIVLQGAATLYISGINLTTTGNANSGCLTVNSGLCFINGPVNFGPCTGIHMVSNGAAHITIDHSYTINGGASRHYFAFSGGVIATLGIPSSNIVVTLAGTPNFSTVGFADASSNGTITLTASSMSFSGNAIGSRYQASMGGMIDVLGGGPNFFPGDTAGAVDPSTFSAYRG